ncbi:MAG: nitroreductase family protein [Actinomycetota bacterium]|nr:nitroreductase family protein [Actinomycetota bacterium]
MDLQYALRTNGTVRSFKNDPVGLDTVAAILDDARFAPSGGNGQPWRVAVVEDRPLRRGLAELMQPVWDEYLEIRMAGGQPYTVVGYETPDRITPDKPNELLDNIDSVPVVLAIAADLSKIAMVDADLDRPPMTGGGSIYPFCWNLMLSARHHGLGGVMTTFLSRCEPEAAGLLGLPKDHALVATIFLGHPVRQPTRLNREPVESFATINRFDGVPLQSPTK